LVASTLRKGRPGEPCEPSRDLVFADAGRADHQDVLGHHLFAQLVVEPQAAPAVAQRDRDPRLGVVLADDEAVELGDDFAGEKSVMSRFLFTSHRHSGARANGSGLRPAR